MGRARLLDRCPTDGKNTYRTWEHANDVLHGLADGDTGRVYFCSVAGGYHLTTHTRAEHDRRQADPNRPLSVEALNTIGNLSTEYQTNRDPRLARRLAGSVPGLLRHIRHLNTTNGEHQ